MAAMHRHVTPEMVRFLVVGGVSFIVNQAALVAFNEWLMAPVSDGVRIAGQAFDLRLLVASATAVEVSIIARFALNDVWTFRARRALPLGRRFVASNLSSFGSPIISLACVNIGTPLFGVSYLITNAAGVALGLAWNWWWSTRVVWRHARADIAA